MQKDIIYNLIEKPTYFKTVFPYLKQEYFTEFESSNIFRNVSEHYKKYDEVPTKKELIIAIKSDVTIKGDHEKMVTTTFKSIFTQPSEEFKNSQYLLDKTLEYIQYQEFSTHLLKGAELVQKKEDFSPVVNAFETALKISFDESLGTNLSELDSLVEYYHRDMSTDIQTGIINFDEVVHMHNKTLNLILSVSHGGKSLFLASMTSHLLLKGKNVLFVTLEMSEQETMKRIHANILNIDINTFKTTPKETFTERYNSVKDSLGRLNIKEYAPGVCTTMMIESYKEKLETQHQFIPDVIMIDYVGIMASDRLPQSQMSNSYLYLKSVAEEVRSLSIKLNIPIISAVQLNRDAYGGSGGMENIQGSIAIAQTADTMTILNRTPEMDEVGQAELKIVKNRSTGFLGEKIINIDFSRMRFYSTEDAADNYIDPNPNAAVLSNDVLNDDVVFDF